MPTTPEFSIVIPTVNNPQGLQRLLWSLVLLRGIEKSEVLVVQNPPRRELSCETVSSALNIRWLSSAQGANCARNQGLQRARGKYVFFLDDDCAIDDTELLEKHLSAHIQNPWAFAVGGFYRNLNPSPLAQAYGKIQDQWLQKNQLNPQGECLTLLGGHMSLKRSESMPRFDESIIYGGTETEYFFRIKQQGFRFLLIEAFVGHNPTISASSFKQKAQAQGKTHARLQKEGLFVEAPWTLKPYKKSKYELLYEKHFCGASPSSGPLKKIQTSFKSRLIWFHQKLYFYLENRELF